jgi:type VI protein secretion system component VasK
MLLAAAASGFRPFLTPLPVWDHWMWLILPLCVAVAVVWKAMRVPSLADVPKEAGRLLLYILAGYTAGALLVWAIVSVADHVAG